MINEYDGISVLKFKTEMIQITLYIYFILITTVAIIIII